MRISTKFVPLIVGLLGTFSASATRFTITVGANNIYKYEPAALPIKQGDEVEFVGGSALHPTMSDSSPQAWITFQDASKVIVFNTVGTYPYHCVNHGTAAGQGMAGVITVTAAPLATAAPVAASALNIYPNPSRGLVNITLTERTKADYKLRLRNVIGQEVRTVALHPELSNSLTLDLSDLPAGLYLYSLLVDNKAVLTKRLTLQ